MELLRRVCIMKIIGMMAVYNESDIVEQSVSHMISQGIPLVVLDGGSTDGSYEIVSEFLGRGVLAIERLSTRYFELETQLRRLCEMATGHNPDWGVLCDADEFLEPPRRDLTLAQAIEVEDANGYNLIQFNSFVFMPTELDENSTENDVRERLRYYSWVDDFHFRAWKFYPGTTIHEHGGHFPVFPIEQEINISPNKFVQRHYKIRSYEQGSKKVFEERLGRYSPTELKKGWHIHYSNFKRDRTSFVIDSKKLTRYAEDGRWSLEPTFGDWPAGRLFPEVIVLRRRLDEKQARIRRFENEEATKEAKIMALESEREQLLDSLRRAQLQLGKRNLSTEQ
jgi:glycosyltransferase involved in cell wall biosynthesis